MLSKKENLLVRPWQLQRFYNHRRKIASALPAIDFGPPATYGHVNLKLKKQQKETERCEKIARENIKLLQRLGAIMKVNRLDNHWETPQPNFLNRQTINFPNVQINNKRIRPKTTDARSSEEKICERFTRCKSCNPNHGGPIERKPQERVPWEVPSKSSSRRSSLPLLNCKKCGNIVGKH